MSQDLFLVADIGTSSCKSSLINVAGQVLATCYAEYPTVYPKPLFAEQNPDDWWQAFVQTTQQLLSQTRIDPAAILAVSISGNTPSVLPLNKHGMPLYNAMIWMDRRSEAECVWLKQRQETVDIEQITVNRIDPTFSLPKLLWLRRYEPHIFQEASTYLQSNGYIVCKLTGNFSVDITHCSLTQLFDLANETWSEPICTLIDLDVNKLPPIYRCYEIVGEITKSSADLTGLKKGTPVVAGCNDGAASSLGVGLIHSGQSYIVMGQAGGLGFCTDQRPHNPTFVNYNYAFPGIWFTLAPMAAFGASFRWAKNTLCAFEHHHSDPYELMNEWIKTTHAGSGGVLFLPYMAGERAPIWDSNARGVFLGLSLATTRADLLRAVMEGTAFSLRHNVDTFEQAQITIGDLLCTGGGSKSPMWNQITADVLNRPIITLKNEENVTLGNAIIAGYGIGSYSDRDLHAKIQEFIIPDKTYYPEASRHATYSQLFELYKRAYLHLKQDFADLQTIVLA